MGVVVYFFKPATDAEGKLVYPGNNRLSHRHSFKACLIYKLV